MAEPTTYQLRLLSQAVEGDNFLQSVTDQLAGLVTDGSYFCDEFKENIQLLETFIRCSDQIENHALIENITKAVCISSLQHIHPTYDSRVKTSALISQICSLLMSCLRLLPEKCCTDLLAVCLQSLKLHVRESMSHPNLSGDHSQENVLDLHCCLEVIRNYCSNNSILSQRSQTGHISELEDHLLENVYAEVLCVIYQFNDKVILSLAQNCVLKLLKCSSSARLPERLTACWEIICSLFVNASSSCDDKPHMLLCGLADFYFPVENVHHGVDLTYSESFWKLVQSGLYHKNPLTRKRSIYLLKRITDILEKCGSNVHGDFDVANVPLFWWSPAAQPQLSKLWEDIVMLLETLEERQVHVIKPVLPKMQSLLKAVSIDKEGKFPHLHSSWLTMMIKRSLMHESIYIVRWAAELVMTLNLKEYPMMQHGQDVYLSTDFLLSIQEPKLYVREQGITLGTSPGCGNSIIKFFNNCWEALDTPEKKASFFQQVLKTIFSNTWGPIPLLFIFQALSHVTKSPILDPDGLVDLRKTMISNLTTWSQYMRGAVQCFCGKILINLVDTESVTPPHFASVLSVFYKEESLQRGTTLWSQFVTFLKQVSTSGLKYWSCDSINRFLRDSTIKFLQVHSDTFFTFDETEALAFTRMVLLATDADILTLLSDTQLTSLSLRRLVSLLTEVIIAAPTHPYMSPHKVENAVELLLCLLNELGSIEDDALSECIMGAFRSCSVSLLMFMQQRLVDGWKQILDLPSIELFSSVISAITRSYDPAVTGHLSKVMDTCFKTLNSSSMEENVSMATQIKILGAGALLSGVAKEMKDVKNLPDSWSDIMEKIKDFVRKMNISIRFEKPKTDVSQKEWGKITSMYMYNQWCLLELFLSGGGKLSLQPSAMLDMCLETLSISAGDTIRVVFRCIGYLLHQVTNEGETTKILTALEVTWSCLKNEGKGANYWELLEEFVQMAFQPELMKLESESPIHKKLIQYGEELMRHGEEKTGTVNILMSRILSVSSAEEMLGHAHKFVSIITDGCIFGTIFRKQDKQLVDVYAYLETLEESCSINELKPWYDREAMVRVSIVNFLCQLCPATVQHQQFAATLLSSLKEKYLLLVKESSGQTFSNSHVHRQKNRILQFVMILHPFITEANCTELWDFGWSVLMLEMQPSVRHFGEWMIMLLVCKFQQLIPQIWHKLTKLSEKTTQPLCSLLLIISHLGPHLDSDNQTQYYDTALTKVLPWCLAHHFNTRVHAQGTLVKLWNQCGALNLEGVKDTHAVIQSCFDFYKENNNSTKNVKKLLQNYVFQVLDIKKDHSIETIFHTMPKLALLNDDEWISCKQFQKSCNAAAEVFTSSFIPLHNPREDLKSCPPGPWRYKGTIDREENNDSENGSGDVQKKIMPWRLMSPDDDVLEELEHTKRRCDPDGLILVTSLIDKVPNLGGLCRTSEIFGVSEFVIGKMKYLDDKLFQNLSVTAEKWLPMKEVYHERLPDYLQQKKQSGYTLVGVEQTANSVSLTDFDFPAKTLLLLGNEKEGIPANLINLLDVCVEIPQQGIIRSLNVHVSGALFVWEYRRQQLCKGSEATSTS